MHWPHVSFEKLRAPGTSLIYYRMPAPSRQGLLLTLVRPKRAPGAPRLLEEYIGREPSLLGSARQLPHGPIVDVGVVQLLGRVDDCTVEGGSHHVQQIEVLVVRVPCARVRVKGER